MANVSRLTPSFDERNQASKTLLRWCVQPLLIAAMWGCGERIEQVVIEGAIAPELHIEGELSVQAHRDLWFCKRFLFQSPTLKSNELHASIERSGTQYRMVFDLTDAPYGGLCDWSIDVALVSASKLKERFTTTTVARLFPRSSRAHDFDRAAVFEGGQPWRIACGKSAPAMHAPSCDIQKHVFDDEKPVTHLRLDLSYDTAYVPRRDDD